MKPFITTIFAIFLCLLVSAQDGEIIIEGPNHLYADSVGILHVDVSNCDCKGKLVYSLDDSTMYQTKELKVVKNKATIKIGSSYAGMHGVYLKYSCKKDTHLAKSYFSVSPVFKEPVKIFDIPSSLKAGEAFNVKLLNLEGKKVRLVCEDCESIEKVGPFSYQVMVTNLGECEMYIEELVDGEWEESFYTFPEIE